MQASEKLNFGFSKKLPSFLQNDSCESGLVCLAMIAEFYQKQTDLAKIRQDYLVSSKGLTAPKLVDIAEQLSIDARIIDIKKEEIGNLQTPTILQWDFNHYVVLAEVNATEVIIHDPALGVRKLSFIDLYQHFNGLVIVVTPKVIFSATKDNGQALEQSSKTKFSWKKLLGSTEGLNKSLIHIFVLVFAMEALIIVIPLLNQLIFDQVLVTADTNLLTIVGLGMIFLEITRVLLNTLRGWAVMIMSASLNIQWISNIFSHLIKLPIAWFDRRHLGDICSKFDSVHAIQGMITTRSIEVGLDGFMSIGALIMMFIYNPFLACLVISVVALYFVMRSIWYRSERNATEAGIIFSAQQQSLFMEILRSVKTIRLFNGAEARKARWLNRLIAERNAGLRKQRLSIMMEMGNWILFGAERIAVLWIGTLAVLGNEWSIGMLLAFIAYKDQFTFRAIGIVDKIMEFKMLGIQTERLSDIVLAEKEIEYPARVNIEKLSPELKVHNISYSYFENEHFVIKDCSFEVSEGESVAIIGSSGCGKTTLLKILLGLAHPHSGHISYGSVSLNKIGTREYRDLIGVVMQDDQLFSGSITENITFFSDKPDQLWVEECCRIAAIHPEIEAMPMGYHTFVGEMGSALSGGQKQRLLLARALYKKPKILFLDEATSHLDIVNETMVNNAIRRLKMTTIIVAHRPETIRMADRILFMENGGISTVSKGILEVLAAKNAPVELSEFKKDPSN